MVPPDTSDTSGDVAVGVQAAAGWSHPTAQPLPAWPATSPTPLPALPPPVPQIAPPPVQNVPAAVVVQSWPEIPRLRSLSFWVFVLSHFVLFVLMPLVLDWVPRSPLPMVFWSILLVAILVACSRSFFKRMSEVASLHGGDFTPKRTRLVSMVTHGLVMLLLTAFSLYLSLDGEALRLPAEKTDTVGERTDTVLSTRDLMEVCLVVVMLVLMPTLRTLMEQAPWSRHQALQRAALTVSCDLTGSMVALLVMFMATGVLLSTFGEGASRAKEG
ncbi:unnamed protein product [Vitrella brassicaformis CCMP3155]|uniref:Uncharacterized protein n=1 Tax=Vitrella brassicaformis (strain CCMP3155) TaxID=1169540 RepID=A0A0G4ER09_VITBC|nr:unnamed protein product [Vitrella brassicaformis CCMP3155]|eukprot:CEL99695.1 unnamed protein product [Vitrella brassicaformis CCMP3155]